MAKQKKFKTEPVEQNNSSKNVLSQIRWGESYTSLLLGFVVVVVAAVLVFSFVKNRNMQTDVTPTSAEDAVMQINKDGKELPKTYEVKAGEYLWSISEKIYGTGYNWVDLAEANKMENPEIVSVGTKLNIPNVEAKVLETEEEAIKGDSYVVREGDYLWDIAIRAYGDGYKWVEIAKANNLTNPDYIFTGTTLKLSR
ncbi:LysM peptidoglycan-binding domain-containing protein [Patescibacteria group bacterium]|nr:LysM peptidoglycan-binding domain-containing protein [Patescibacteria group bacterium]